MLFIGLPTGAAFNVLTQAITRVLPPTALDRMTPSVLAPPFRLDGEYAFDAARYAKSKARGEIIEIVDRAT